MADGKGEIEARIEPVSELKAVTFECLPEEQVDGIAAVTNLPSHIPHRMARRAINLLTDAGLKPGIEPHRARGAGPGAGIILWQSQGGFSALGRKGLPADKVAESAVKDLIAYLDNGAAVDYHLADQLLIPMALADGTSSFSVDRLSRHTLTNIQLLKERLGVEATVSGQLDEPGTVKIRGINLVGD
jgi:RNA 3'-terminal phosphate cyclase (ATP)